MRVRRLKRGPRACVLRVTPPAASVLRRRDHQAYTRTAGLDSLPSHPHDHQCGPRCLPIGSAGGIRGRIAFRGEHGAKERRATRVRRPGHGIRRNAAVNGGRWRSWACVCITTNFIFRPETALYYRTLHVPPENQPERNSTCCLLSVHASTVTLHLHTDHRHRNPIRSTPSTTHPIPRHFITIVRFDFLRPLGAWIRRDSGGQIGNSFNFMGAPGATTTDHMTTDGHAHKESLPASKMLSIPVPAWRSVR